MPNVSKAFCNQYLTLPLNIPFVLKFNLDGTYRWIGGNDHTITLSCSNSAVQLSTKRVTIEEGWSFLTKIQSSAVGSAVLEISVDGTLNLSVPFNFLNNKDVFQSTRFNLLMDELKYVAAEVNKPIRHSEYAGNYCMGASERGLSELLRDFTNFYAVTRGTHAKKNTVSFLNKSAVDRGKVFQSLGYTAANHNFNNYTINHTKKDLIYNAKDVTAATDAYKAERYNMIELTSANKAALTKIFESDLKNKEIGYHIYYFTVTDGFHTLMLLIDTISDPCNPKYEIWDQHGLTSSSGSLTDIAEGIRKQTSWTFANSCLNRYKNGTTKYYDSTNTYLWKIKEK